MIDAVKDYLAPKRFGVVAYVCLIVHFLCGLAFTAVTSALRTSEIGKFSCTVDTTSTATYRIYVEKTCHSRYEQAYNSPVPLYGFVLLSTGLIVLVSVIYSLGVSNRVDEIERISSGSDEPRTNSRETKRGFYVFYFYFLHLAFRVLFGILFTVLQYSVFYPKGFDFEFCCTLPTSDLKREFTGNRTSMGDFNTTSIACKNLTASEKQLWSIIVSALNTICALIIFGEVICLWRRFPNCHFVNGWTSDDEFITVYLLRKRYNDMQDELELTGMVNPSPDSTPDISTANNDIDNLVANSTPAVLESTLQDSIEWYKRLVLDAPRALDICYAPKTDLDAMYIDVVIHTGRAEHKFSKKMDRHEIFDVYMKVPDSSIRLEEIKDLFCPNIDTHGSFPRTVLAVGRPGIGKTVLTEKIIRDWANGVNELYSDKIAFLLKFRWFNFEELKNLSLKTFLRYGTGGLSEAKFESIYDEIINEPKKAIFVFDGLDEFNGDLTNCLGQSKMLPNDLNMDTSAINFFVKLICGQMLQGATIVVTSRPTADSFYSRLNFDRSVEIIGFTSDKIEKYVSRFCKNNGRSDLKPKIWDHITSSSDLLNLCYIPVNCFIVCVTVSECLSHPENDTGSLPTTLTELYSAAIDHFAMYHDRNLDQSSSSAIEKLQDLAFRGIENGQLVFKKELFDAKMKLSGLINSLSNPIFPVRTQFCFIHLTVQEFLAARLVIETLAPNAIVKFISDHIDRGKWYLVLQFLAGLLGEKSKMFTSDYHECIMSFARSLTFREDKTINLNDFSHVLVMKCLREVDDEDIVKQVCETTDLNVVTRICHKDSETPLSASEWAAVTFVWKYLNSVKDLVLAHLMEADNRFDDVSKFVQQRCAESLALFDHVRLATSCSDFAKKQLFSSLMHSKCALEHNHAKLTAFRLSINLHDEDASMVCAFLKSENANYLQRLDLSYNDLTSDGISQLCEVFKEKFCKQLAYLDFNTNFLLGNECLNMLCDALIQGQYTLLKSLILGNCCLTAPCVNRLCTYLCDEHCHLNVLELEADYIGDEGIRMLCTNALRREQCELSELGLDTCYLTDQCVPLLCETLQDRNCKLTKLSLYGNQFTEEGRDLLRAVGTTEICKARSYRCNIERE